MYDFYLSGSPQNMLVREDKWNDPWQIVKRSIYTTSALSEILRKLRAITHSFIFIGVGVHNLLLNCPVRFLIVAYKYMLRDGRIDYTNHGWWWSVAFTWCWHLFTRGHDSLALHPRLHCRRPAYTEAICQRLFVLFLVAAFVSNPLARFCLIKHCCRRR